VKEPVPLLLHVCCAPCLTVVHRELAREGFSVSGHFFNPNIHPWKEWKRRRDAFSEYASHLGMETIIDDSYPLEECLKRFLAVENRCEECFGWRLIKTAEAAAETGAQAFSTTLSVSPYQDHDLLKEMGRRAQDAHHVEFIYRDFRDLYRESVDISRAMDMYRQPYCGCVFSERDRYLKIP